jgi:hypothetical protein
MVKYILFIIFFTAPPAAPGKQVWQFSNSAQFEFASMAGCTTFGKHLQAQIATTTTMTMRGWCVEDHSGLSTYDLSAPPPPTIYDLPVKSR